MIHQGDCIETMKKMIDEGIKVDSIVTDPPYELGFMGKKWDSSGIAYNWETWSLCLDLLKSGGHLLSFGGSRTYHRMAVAIEDGGFEIRDQLMWLYGNGFPKSLNIGKAIDKKQGYKREKVDASGMLHKNTNMNDDGWYKRNQENPQMDSDKPVGEDAIKFSGWGTALKPAHEPIVLARKPISEKTITDNVLKHGTGGINIDGCRVGLSELGRFPANVIHNGLQEDWARYFYCPKASKKERNFGLIDLEEKQYSFDGRKKEIENPFQRNKSVAKNNHPTVKPIKLMQYLCRLITPKGGTVLDPFMGSGTTGLACEAEGFDFIGIEKEEEYFETAKARLKSQEKQMVLHGQI